MLEKIEQLLQQADRAYYEQDDPIMSDADYDLLAARYENLTGQRWMTLGKASAQLTRIPHQVPMLSLEKVTSMEAFGNWLHPGVRYYTCLPKIDGMSCALRYKKGKLHMALTRGDGAVGESILHNVQALVGKHIPETLPIHQDAEVRGEIYIPLSLWQAEWGKNPRNVAAGYMRRQTVTRDAQRVRFIAYRLLQDTAFQTYTETLKTLADYGFQVPPWLRIADDKIPGLTADKLHPSSWAGNLDYEIDGTVISIDDLQLHARLGETHKYPRWACAYKFETMRAQTRLLNVEWAAGRTGVIVPTAVFEAVDLCGTTVNRATLHNFKFYQDLGAEPGDIIEVSKRNEIIPAVERLVQKAGSNLQG